MAAEDMERRAEGIRLEDEQERVLTLKIDLEGPAELVSWIRENSPPSVGRRLADLLPGDFRKHMRAAQREQLLAMRSLLDSMIQRLEGEGRPVKKAVDVEVE